MISNKKIHSSEEAKQIMDEYINESSQRLQQRLRQEWKKQTAQIQKENGYATHSI